MTDEEKTMDMKEDVDIEVEAKEEPMAAASVGVEPKKEEPKKEQAKAAPKKKTVTVTVREGMGEKLHEIIDWFVDAYAQHEATVERTGDVIKMDIHGDDRERVFGYLKRYPDVLSVK